MTNTTTTKARDVRYDYNQQAWVVDGAYVRCGHPKAMPCACYGRAHAGEAATKHGAACVMAFGRPSPVGDCARCDELRAGSPARNGWRK